MNRKSYFQGSLDFSNYYIFWKMILMKLEMKIKIKSGLRLKTLRTSIFFLKLEMKIKIKSGLRLKMLRTSIFFCIRTYPTKLITCDTSLRQVRWSTLQFSTKLSPCPTLLVSPLVVRPLAKVTENRALVFSDILHEVRGP